jgi:peptidyl-dipeptidase Dcp
VTYADNRATQEDGCFGKRFQNNELDNQQNVFKIAKLRFDSPTLGYATHAHFVLGKEWLRVLRVNTFSKDLLEKQNQLLKRICRFNVS